VGRVNFTDRFLGALKTPDTGRTTVHDSTVRGLGVLVQKTGTKSFFWARRTNAKLVYHTLGSCSDVTLEQARARASEINAAVAKWKEAGYVGRRRLERPATSSRLAAFSMTTLACT
jgi:hypothetical protein